MANPNKFYTYAYLRDDGTPYYIGKGSGNRAYKRTRADIKPPIDKSRIIILKQNITEEGAFKHEKYMIFVFGRKDLGTGILYNRTDGGDGSSGVIRPQELRDKISKKLKGKIVLEKTREKLRESSKGRKLSEDAKQKISKFNKGKKMSEEAKKKMSKSRKDKKFSQETRDKIRKSKLGKTTSLKGKTYEEIYGDFYLEKIENLRIKNTGKTHSEETKQKISNSKKGTVPWNKGMIFETKNTYHFENSQKEIIITKNLSNFCKQNNLNITCIRRLISNKQRQHKGWTFIQMEC